MAALGYVLLCGWLAAAVSRRFTTDRLLIAVAVFFGIFFFCFQLLGCLELFTGWRLANTGLAALLLLLALPLAMPAVRRIRTVRVGSMPPAPRRSGALDKATLAVFLLAALMLAFGRPQGYEVLAYHLPIAVNLLQTQSLMAWDGNFPHTFPANASVLWAVLLEALPERLVSMANLVLLVPLVLAAHALCRLADGDRNAARYACCGLLGVPMIAFSSMELGADIGGIAFVALAMYFVLSPQRAPAAMALGGLCAGLAFGFKSLHLISALCIAPLAWGRGDGLRAAARNTALFIAAASLAGGFWMLRNAVMLGNPLHPVGVPLVGELLGWLPAPDFDPAQRRATQGEWVRSSWQWLVYPWTEPHLHGQNFKHSSGLGAFVAAAMPGTAVAVGAAVWRDGWRAHRIRAALLYAVLCIVAAWWLLGDRQPRYVLAALPLALPLLAWAITQATGSWRRLFDTGLALCILAMLGVFLSRQLLQFGDRIVLSGQTARSAFYEYPPLVDSLPAPAVILNLADRLWHYPLAGAALSNRVVSMPEGRRLLGLPPSLTAPASVHLRAAPLRAAGVTHVYIAGAAFTLDPCLGLDEVARLERNPVNGMPLPSPRKLYAVRYLCGPGAIP